MIGRIAGGIALAVVAAFVAMIMLTDSSYVRTPSMYPTIPPGSEVFIGQATSYHVGDVIEFKGNGLTWLHRLVKIDPDGTIVTKGDNPQNSPDVFVPALTVHDIMGRVTHAPSGLGFPQFLAQHPREALGWLRAELGITGKVILLCCVGVLAALASYPGRQRKKHAAKHRPLPYPRAA